MTDFMQFVIGGLVLGSIYALVAMGFVIIYKATSVLNFAQGEFLMVGGYVCLHLILAYRISFVAAFLATLGFAVILGLVVEALVVRPLNRQPAIAVVMATIGLSSVLKGIVIAIWGNASRPFPELFAPQPYLIHGVAVDPVYVWACGGAALLMVLCGMFFRFTRTGVAMRAVASDPQAAQSMGIRVTRICALAWCISAVVSAMGGVLIGIINGVGLPLAHFGLKVFPAVILGGLDSVVGAIIGGLMLGLIENLCGGYLDPLLPGSKQVAPFVFLVLILMLRPHGLFGTKRVERI